MFEKGSKEMLNVQLVVVPFVCERKLFGKCYQVHITNAILTLFKFCLFKVSIKFHVSKVSKFRTNL